MALAAAWSSPNLLALTELIWVDLKETTGLIFGSEVIRLLSSIFGLRIFRVLPTL